MGMETETLGWVWETRQEGGGVGWGGVSTERRRKVERGTCRDRKSYWGLREEESDSPRPNLNL